MTRPSEWLSRIMELKSELLYVIVFGPGFGESIVIRPPGHDAAWLFVDCCYDQQYVNKPLWLIDGILGEGEGTIS